MADTFEGLELLQRAADAGAKLLAVQRLPAMESGGADEEQVGAAFLLIFDAGRILLSARPAAHGLHAMHLEDKEDAPSGLVSAVEEEPWWRLLGCLLASASAEEAGARLRLELRATGDSSRSVILVLEGERVRASLSK